MLSLIQLIFKMKIFKKKMKWVGLREMENKKFYIILFFKNHDLIYFITFLKKLKWIFELRLNCTFCFSIIVIV